MTLTGFLGRFTIRARMLGAIALVMLLLGAVGGAGLLGLARVGALGERFVSGPHEDTVTLAELRHALDEVRRLEKDMVINYENSAKVLALRPGWEAAAERVRAQAKKLGAGQSAGASAAARQQLDALMARYVETAAPVLNQIGAGGYDTATVADRMLARAKETFTAAEAQAGALQQQLQQAAAASLQAREQAMRETHLMFGAVVLLAIAVVVPLTLANMASISRPLDEAKALAQRIATGDLSGQVEPRGRNEIVSLQHALLDMQASLRRIVGEVRRGAQTIQDASTEVASGNADLSDRTEQAAASLQETASSMTQLTVTVGQSADAAATANQLASSAAQVAQRGGEVVSRVVSTMDDIHASSRKIADIIGVIDGIAFQTNILALNAAVEAARAGEQGRGFAVVAGEVRSLAQRSADAAKEIKALIGSSVGKVETGSKLVQDAGATMQEIVSSVQRVTDIIGEISAAAREQSHGIGQINTAVTQLEQMTQQNAALVEQSAAAAESLKAQARRMASVVATFRLDADAPAAMAEAKPLADEAIERARREARAEAAPKEAEAEAVPAAAATPPARQGAGGWEAF